MKDKLIIALFFFASSSVYAGHHEGGHHDHAGNSKEWEIKAYTSAAPRFIGDHATVIGA